MLAAQKESVKSKVNRAVIRQEQSMVRLFAKGRESEALKALCAACAEPAAKALRSLVERNRMWQELKEREAKQLTLFFLLVAHIETYVRGRSKCWQPEQAAHLRESRD